MIVEGTMARELRHLGSILTDREIDRQVQQTAQ